jgi:hypothetical protein
VKLHAALLGAGVHAAEAGQAQGQPALYQHHEVLLIRRIRQLLYEEGFTIMAHVIASTRRWSRRPSDPGWQLG